MTKMRLILVAIAKSMAVTLAVLTFSSAIFGFFCIFAFHAKFSVKGCSILLAVSSVLWLWACWRSEEPALRTFVTLLLHSTLIFLFFLGISLLRFMLEHSDSIAAWHVIVLLTTVALFWYLRGVVIRRNKQTERLIHEHDVA
ncbi:MAG: hypothetical protein ABR955_09790 [Verrucomicrobiota bacterium]|jgi:hypothetical protein